MSPPCLNCHGVPYTTRWEGPELLGECHPAEGDRPATFDCLSPVGPSEIWADAERLRTWRRWLREHPDIFSSPPPFDIPLPARDPAEPLPECTAPDWPEWLRQDHPERQQDVWWVRNNFERTRYATPPLRVDIGRAEIDLTIHPRWGATLPLVRGWVDLVAGVDSRLSTHQVIDHNEISLVMNHLVDFQNVGIEGPLGTELPLQQINIGDFGGLHAVGVVPTWNLFFIQPFMVPIPPTGYDHPTWDQWRALYDLPNWGDRCMDPTFAVENVGLCPQPLRIPDRRHDTAPLDLELLDLLPEGLRCRLEPLLSPDGRLPDSLNLEDLFTLIPRMRERECPAGSGRGITAAELLNFLRSGEISIQLEQLNDLFIPGVLDLGPSRAQLRAHRLVDGTLVADLFELQADLEPMGYGMETATSEPRSQIFSGRVSSLPSTPAVHVEYRPEDGTLLANLNLHFYLDQEGLIPGLGTASLEGDLHAQVTLVNTPEGLRPIPGSLTVALENLEILRYAADPPTEIHLNLFLSDDPAAMDPLDSTLALVEEYPRAQLRVEGEAAGHEFSVTGALHLRQDSNGLYLLPHGASIPEILHTLPLEDLSLELYDIFPETGSGGTSGVHAWLELKNQTEVGDDPEDGHPPHFTGWAQADRLMLGEFRGRHRPPKTRAPLVEDAFLDFAYFEHPRETPAHEEGSLRIAIDSFEWPVPIGRIVLRDILANLAIDRLRVSDEESRVRIPFLSLEANTTRPGRGITRGPIEIVQSRSDGLELVWNSADRTLAMTGLDLFLNAQGLRVLPERLLRTLDPEVAGVGIDGHLAGDFQMHLTEDRRCWHGEGEISLRGDEAGDIYFLNSRGRRVGPALFRDTRWSFRRVNWINWDRGYALGDFSLRTLINPSAAPGYSSDLGPFTTGGESEPMFGSGGVRLLPYEISAMMAYDNQPWGPAGFRHRIEDYILNIYLSPQATLRISSPRVPSFCREAEGGDR